MRSEGVSPGLGDTEIRVEAQNQQVPWEAWCWCCGLNILRYSPLVPVMIAGSVCG